MGSTSLALAAPGDLDPSFGNGGKATFNLGLPTYGASDIALQADGKILATTTLLGPSNSDIATVRITPQGAQDQSFGGTPGFSDLNFRPSDTGSGLIVQPGGKVDVVGTVDTGLGGLKFVLARLDQQGLLDTSFDPAGTPGFLESKYSTLSTNGAADLGFGVALQGDNILVAGGSSLTDPGALDFAVARVLNPDGVLDNGFGASGGAFLDFQSHGYDEAEDVAVQPDGKIVLAGISLGNGMAVARLLPDGTPDNSFGNQGKVLVPGGNASDLAIQPDGKLVLVGTDKGDAIVARLKPDGSPDNSFGGDGRTAVDFGSNDAGSGVALQADGKVVITGSTGTGDAMDFAVARLQPNGIPDSTFADNGEAKVDLGADDIASSVAIQPDGKIVAAGFSGPTTDPAPRGDIALVRLQGDAGAHKAKCAGKKATIVGTNRKDKLKGTKKRDVIAALGGKDTVKGKGGNDIICGGKGKDKLLGGPGKDKLLGQAGKDTSCGVARARTRSRADRART